MVWKEYEKGVGARVIDLHSRIHRGGYRVRPSRRSYISKEDGSQRAIGIAALEDKIVQQAGGVSGRVERWRGALDLGSLFP